MNLFCSMSEIHDYMLRFKFFLNECDEPVFQSRYDAKRFVNQVLKVRNPEFVYRIMDAYDQDGYQICVIYVAKPFSIKLKGVGKTDASRS